MVGAKIPELLEIHLCRQRCTSLLKLAYFWGNWSDINLSKFTSADRTQHFELVKNSSVMEYSVQHFKLVPNLWNLFILHVCTESFPWLSVWKSFHIVENPLETQIVFKQHHHCYVKTALLENCCLCVLETFCVFVFLYFTRRCGTSRFYCWRNSSSGSPKVCKKLLVQISVPQIIIYTFLNFWISKIENEFWLRKRNVVKKPEMPASQ